MNHYLSSAAFVACLSVANIATAETTLILGEAGPNRGARADAMQSFADDVSARTNGDVTIDIQWGGALFKANAALTSVADGVADLGSVIGVYFPQELIGYGIADLPLESADAWVGMRATDDLMRSSDAIIANLAAQNLVYIGTGTTSAVNIACNNVAIRTVEDIDGLKVRGVGAYGTTFGDFGANLVSMSIYDAYQGLDSGLLDCSQGYSYAIASLKQQEVITSYTILNWGQIGALGIFMNKDSYDALDAETQAAMNDAGIAMADKLGELITADNEAAIQTMIDAGVEIIELAPAERNKLVEQGAQYVDEWVERADGSGLEGAALLEQYRALLVKYAEERDTQGYPWTR